MVKHTRNLLLILCFIHSFNLEASEETSQPLSKISVPLNINLALIEERLNSDIPNLLEKIDVNGQICVKAKWLKTKAGPDLGKCKIRGFKISCPSKWIKTKTTPDIKCDLDGWVKRNGKITVDGAGSKLTVSVPLKAKVTAQGRGDIGKNITQTVDGATVITATIEASLKEDWTPEVKLDAGLRWTDRPSFKLFNLIPITVGSKAEDEFEEELKKLKASFPTLLANAKIKENVETAWLELQKPITLDEENNLYANFTPKEIGFSGINTTNNITTASFMIEGRSNVYAGKSRDSQTIVSLPNLKKINYGSSGVNVVIPITAKFDQLEDSANSQISNLSPIQLEKFGQKGELEISNIGLSGKNGLFNLSADFSLDNDEGFLSKLDIFGFFDVDGKVTFSAKPIIDENKNTLSISELEFDSDSNGLLVDSLVTIAKLKPIREKIRESLTYKYGDEIIKLKNLLGKEMNRELGDGVETVGKIDSISLGEVVIDDSSLSIPIKLSGEAKVLVGLVSTL